MEETAAKDFFALPESLESQLHRFRRRLFAAETVVATLGAFSGLLFSYVLLMVADRVISTPAWIRASILLIGVGLLAAFSTYWLHRWWWARRSGRELARMVQRHYPRLGDRLQGAVELSASRDPHEHISPSLCRAALRQIAEEAERYDFASAVDRRTPRITAVTFAAVAVLSALPFILVPELGVSTLGRWLRPLAPLPRFTFARLGAVPQEKVVPHGEAFEVPLRVLPDSRWQPPWASGRIDSQPRVKVPVVDGEARLGLPGQTDTGTLSVRAGDDGFRMRIRPVHRPELVKLRAKIELPAYLRRPAETIDLLLPQATLLQGSTVAFEGTADRALKSATVAIEMKVEGDSAGLVRTQAMDVVAHTFTSPDALAASSSACSFRWADVFELAGPRPHRLHIQTVEDQTPLVACRGLGRTVAMLEDEIVDIQIHAEDDYGLRDLHVSWKALPLKGNAGVVADGSQALAAGTPTTTQLDHDFRFSPLALRIPEETHVTLRASAADFQPERQASLSSPHHIFILSKARHARLIQDRIEAIRAAIEELAREEERLRERNIELAGLDPEELANDATTSALRDSELSELDHAEELERLAREVEAVLKEALRNGEISPEFLRRWAEIAARMRNLAGGEMAQAAGELQASWVDKRRRAAELAAALRTEEAILKALRELEQGMALSLEDLLAETFVNRLLILAAVEAKIANGLRELMPSAIGVPAEELPEPVRVEMNTLGARQDDARTEAEHIRDDLVGFYNRTRIECYDTVALEMKEKRTGEALAELTGLIKKNRSGEAIGAATGWQKQFSSWAEALRKGRSASGSGQGAGGQSLSMEDIEVLISLIRARQREESLRAQTRVLEQSRGSSPDYGAQAQRLAETQRDIMHDVMPLGLKTRISCLRDLIGNVVAEMGTAATYLARSQTDSETIAIETAIIELLANAIASGCAQCGSKGLALLRSLGYGGISPGGGSYAGGEAGPNTPVAGDAVLAAPGSRSVDMAGGTTGDAVPEEYREALQAYHLALEERP